MPQGDSEVHKGKAMFCATITGGYVGSHKWEGLPHSDTTIVNVSLHVIHSIQLMDSFRGVPKVVRAQ